MDKFSIFELLDTLSQIAASAQEENTGEQEASVSPPSADDKAFQPPYFNGATPNAQLQRDALDALYQRHESISKRIDKKK